MDRGLDGIRWSVTGRWAGSLEIWLEEVGDGVLVHHYARLDPVDPATGAARPLPDGPVRPPTGRAGARRPGAGLEAHDLGAQGRARGGTGRWGRRGPGRPLPGPPPASGPGDPATARTR